MKATITFTDSEGDSNVAVKISFKPDLEADGSNSTPAVAAAIKAFELFMADGDVKKNSAKLRGKR